MGPMHSLRKNRLEKIQRQAARFVHASYTARTPGCVTKVLQDLGWDSLEHRGHLQTIDDLQHPPSVSRGFWLILTSPAE